ncbi:hypothetical protein [Variovorax sp.]|uniref:hypothetical protein n=1 Tax=Variovorax sp. TaxID=1871043 RepID=UPI002D77519C|nr:hypothetical protein [Variovorax sp.]
MAAHPVSVPSGHRSFGRKVAAAVSRKPISSTALLSTHRTTYSAVARALFCLLAFALCFASSLGQLHRAVHGLKAGHSTLRTGAKNDTGEAREAAKKVLQQSTGLLGHLFDEGHSAGDCLLYDQLSTGPAACGFFALDLPILLSSAALVRREGQALSRWVALFDARGPPLAR